MTAVSRAPRVVSIDVVRGLDVLLMLFVNEMAGVRGTPGFLLHMPAWQDGMTLADIVFPAFLFITGMAIPLALRGRLTRESRAAVWRHVLARGASLLAIGALMVNAERASPHGLLSPPLWNILMTIAVALVWSAPASFDSGPPSSPRERPRTRSPRGGPRRRAVIRASGLAMLLVLALLYRSDGLTGLMQLRPHWWGILGLIGWAYLVAASIYLLVGDRPALLVGAMALLYAVYFAQELSVLPVLATTRLVNVGRVLASQGALVVSGTVLTVMLLRHQGRGAPAERFVVTAVGYAAALAAAGLLLHTLRDVHSAFWISKLKATAAWCLLAGAFTAAAWVVVYWLADVRGWRRWPKAVHMAGENALVVYLMEAFALSVFALASPLFGGKNPYYAIGGTLWLGTLRAVAFAWVVVRVSGWLGARGVRLQL